MRGNVSAQVRRFAIGGASLVAIALASTTAFAQSATTQSDAQNTPGEPTVQDGAAPSTVTQKQIDDKKVTTSKTASGEIVVTGYRAALQSAQSIKQNAEQFVDSITATDIGKLPDTNLSEALQRISGIQTTREYGEGNGVAIRGLTEVRTELNGRDIFSANGGRGLSWDEVGVDLLAGVDVYKNPSAELTEGGLSGTVNIRTRLPFDQKGQLVSLTLANTYYDQAKTSKPTVSALYSNRWHTGIGEIGFLVNGAYQKTTFREDSAFVEPYWEHGPAGATDPFNLTPILAPLPGHENEVVLAPHGFRVGADFGDRQRISASSALQWKPADNLEFYAQYFRTDYKFFDHGVSLVANGDTDLTPAAGSTWNVSNGVATSGSWTDPNTNALTYGQRRKTSTQDISGGVKWQPTRRLHVSADYQHIDSKASYWNLQMQLAALNPVRNSAQAAPGLNTQNYNLDFDTTGSLPNVMSSIPGYFSDPNNYGLVSILPYREKNNAKSDAARADMTWDFDEGFIKKISVGARYTNKSAINRNTTYGTWSAIGTGCANWADQSGCYSLAKFPEAGQRDPYQDSIFRGAGASSLFGPFYEVASNLTDNPQQAFNYVNSISGSNITWRSFTDPNSFYGTIKEKTYAGYLRVAFGAHLSGDMKFDGNIGLRYVDTREQAIGSQSLSYRQFGAPPVVDPVTGQISAPPTISNLSPFTGGHNYAKWLPSINLRFYITPTLLIRAAASKNFYRPDFTQLNPSFGLSPTYSGTASIPETVSGGAVSATNPYVGSGSAAGNPDLRPERATSFDLALEWYFKKSGFVYASLFYKDIKDLIQNENTTLTRTIDGIGPVQFNITGPQNVANSKIKGFEAGGQRFFDFLPAPFDGFGIQANFTLVDSSAGQIAIGNINNTNSVKVPIANLSKYSYNLVGLYSKDKLNVRLAYNWRSHYYQGLIGNVPINVPVYGAGVGFMDGSVSYDVNKHFSLTLDGQNLLNTVQHFYQYNPSLPRQYIMDDRRISIRARLLF